MIAKCKEHAQAAGFGIILERNKQDCPYCKIDTLLARVDELDKLSTEYAKIASDRGKRTTELEKEIVELMTNWWTWYALQPRLKRELYQASANWSDEQQRCREVEVENQRLRDQIAERGGWVTPKEAIAQAKQDTAREILIHLMSNEYTHEGSVLCQWIIKKFGLEG
jgi:glutaredoxin